MQQSAFRRFSVVAQCREWCPPAIEMHGKFRRRDVHAGRPLLLERSSDLAMQLGEYRRDETLVERLSEERVAKGIGSLRRAALLGGTRHNDPYLFAQQLVAGIRDTQCIAFEHERQCVDANRSRTLRPQRAAHAARSRAWPSGDQ